MITIEVDIIWSYSENLNQEPTMHVELNFAFIINRSISELNTETINRQSISNYSINLLKLS